MASPSSLPTAEHFCLRRRQLWFYLRLPQVGACTSIFTLPALGSIFDIIFMHPASFLSHINAGPFITVARYLFVAAALYAFWHQFHDPILQMLPIRSLQRQYYPPDTP
jgi:hypothetical protein